MATDDTLRGEISLRLDETDSLSDQISKLLLHKLNPNMSVSVYVIKDRGRELHYSFFTNMHVAMGGKFPNTKTKRYHIHMVQKK